MIFISMTTTAFARPSVGILPIFSHVLSHISSLSVCPLIAQHGDPDWAPDSRLSGGAVNSFIKLTAITNGHAFAWLLQVNLDMTDHCTTDFCIWRTICLVPVWCISSIRHMYMTDFAYDGPIFLVPLSLSYPGSPITFQCLLEAPPLLPCQPPRFIPTTGYLHSCWVILTSWWRV